MQDALQAAKAGLIDVLLVYRVDRFSRSLRDTVTLLDELDAAGVAFRSATEPFDTSNPMGRILLQLLSMFAQFERDVLIDRVIAGMERKAAQGKWRGGQHPFGYLVDKATNFLIPNTSEEAVVRLIFNLYVNERIGTRAIATVLNDRGHRTAAGGIFSGHQVLRALTNRVYLGEISFRDIVVEKCHPPLIEADTWDRVQRLVKCRSESHAYRAAGGSDYIATGRLTCPKCGKPMIGTRATGRTHTYRHYTCWNRSRYGTTKCDADRINADALDTAVLDAIASFYQIQHVLTEEAVNAAREAYTASHCTLAAELTAVQAEIRRTTSKIDKYLSAFEGGTLTSEDVSGRLAALKTTGTQLSRRRGELLAKWSCL